MHASSSGNYIAEEAFKNSFMQQSRFYKTMGGYSFSIVVRSSFCPYSVDVNPESGRVRY